MADHLISQNMPDQTSTDSAFHIRASAWQQIYAQEMSPLMAALLSAALPDLPHSHLFGPGNYLEWDGSGHKFDLIAGLLPNKAGSDFKSAPHPFVQHSMGLLQPHGHVMVYGNGRWLLQVNMHTSSCRVTVIAQLAACQSSALTCMA